MSRRRTRPEPPDPYDPSAVDVRFVQPYEANKAYLCPWCNRDLPPGTGHVVVVPHDAADLRRHWHRGCWDKRVRASSTGSDPTSAFSRQPR
ncbi:MAG: hypothetical protein R2754_02815 [Microthrixaceae bacterium]